MGGSVWGERGHLEPQLLQLSQILEVGFVDVARQLAIFGVGVAVSTKRHDVPDNDVRAEQGANGGREDVPHAGDEAAQPAGDGVRPAPNVQLATEGAARRKDPDRGGGSMAAALHGTASATLPLRV